MPFLQRKGLRIEYVKKSIQNRLLVDLPIKHLVTFSRIEWMSMKTDCKTFAIRN
jgi:hypothetical protein